MKKWYEEPYSVKREILKKAELSKNANGETTPELLAEICKKHGREYDNSLYTTVLRV